MEEQNKLNSCEACACLSQNLIFFISSEDARTVGLIFVFFSYVFPLIRTRRIGSSGEIILLHLY